MAPLIKQRHIDILGIQKR